MQLINRCLKVDGQPVNIELKPKQETQLQKSAAAFDQKSAFVIKENAVLQIDVINQKLAEIHRLKDLFLPKLMPLDDSSLLVVGGQSNMEYGRNTVIKKTCYLLSQTQDKQWKTSSQAVMKKQRVSFGCCFLGKGKDFLLVAGGYGAGRRVICDCEVFSVNDNFWTIFPSMGTLRASHSLVLTSNMRYVYAFGGCDLENKPLASIERIKLNNPLDPIKDLNSNWQMIDVSLAQPLLSVGAYMIPNTKGIIIFGGVNEIGEKQSQVFTLNVENEDKN